MMKQDFKITYFVKAKSLLLSILMFAALVILSLLPHSAQAVTLKSQGHVEGNVITLGDIFSGLPENSQKVLGAAPQPGNDMVLNARTLMRIAIAMDLPWRPATNADSITLKRLVTVISPDMLKDNLRVAFKEQGVKGNLELSITQGDSEILLPQSMPATMDIVRLDIDPETSWFQADIAAPSADEPEVTTRVTGRFDRLVFVPVLSETFNKGMLIGKRDISFIEIKERDIDADMILNAEDMLGMTPRRMVMVGKTLKAKDIQAPRMVKRGESVTILFRHGGMLLSARGKAMENGSQGDLIRVVNTASSRSLEAFVSAHKEVTIEAF